MGNKRCGRGRCVNTIWRLLIVSSVSWLVWGFMSLLVLSQFLGIVWNKLEWSEHVVYGTKLGDQAAAILGTNDEPYTDRSLVCIARGRNYVAMQLSQVLLNPKFSHVVDTTGSSISGFRMVRREKMSLKNQVAEHYNQVCGRIDQTLDAIFDGCVSLGYNITRDELRIVGDGTGDTTHLVPHALPIVILPYNDNGLDPHYVIPGLDGMACDVTLIGVYSELSHNEAVLQGVPRSVRESKTEQWLGKSGGVWRNGWYEDGTGQRWFTSMTMTGPPDNPYGLKARYFDTLRNVEIKCSSPLMPRECRSPSIIDRWGKLCTSETAIEQVSLLFISNGSHFGHFMLDGTARRIVTSSYSLETLISNVSILVLLFRWFVSMTAMTNSYRRGTAPWQTAGVGILSCSRTFNLLPAILLPRLKMTMAAFWTVGCEFEGEQRALGDAWFTIYPAIAELLLLYYSVLNFVTKVAQRRMSDACFGPTLFALALLHRFRQQLAQSGWIGVDGRVMSVVASEEFDALALSDVFTPRIGLRLNGNVQLIFFVKIALLALSLLPLLLSENMTKSGKKFRSCNACEIEKALVLRASNVGGIGRSSIYSFFVVGGGNSRYGLARSRLPFDQTEVHVAQARNSVVPFSATDPPKTTRFMEMSHEQTG